jgi:CoA:oxalate CoA-transferase
LPHSVARPAGDQIGAVFPVTAAAVRPLAGILVVEVATRLPGPFAAALLLALGARVVKIEPASGDPLRLLEPEMFRLVNAGKESMCLDLKAPVDQLRLRQVIARTDVLVTNLRLGAQSRLSIDAESIRAYRPELVHLSLTGFAADPERSGHDINYLAESGVLRLFGLGRGSELLLLSMPIADVGGALLGALAVVANLFARRSGQPASGVVMPLQSAAGVLALPGLATILESSQGSGAVMIDRPAYGTFETADGVWVAIGAMEDSQWTRLVSVLHLHQRAPLIARWSLEKRMTAASHVNEELRRVVAETRSNDFLANELASSAGITRVAELDRSAARVEIPGIAHTASTEAPSLGADTERILEEVRGGER